MGRIVKVISGIRVYRFGMAVNKDDIPRVIMPAVQICFTISHAVSLLWYRLPKNIFSAFAWAAWYFAVHGSNSSGGCHEIFFKAASGS